MARFNILRVVSIFFLLVCCSVTRVGNAADDLDYEPRVLLIGIREGAIELPSDSEYSDFNDCKVSLAIRSILSPHGPEVIARVFPGFRSFNYQKYYGVPPLERYLKIYFRTDLDVVSLSEELARLTDVLFAEPNYTVELPFNSAKSTMQSEVLSQQASKILTSPPNDPVYSGVTFDQWNLHNTGFGISCPTAWTHTTGDPSVRIGIIETGMWWYHNDLNGNIAGGCRVASGPSGLYMDVPNTSIYREHPTKCAGIIGASTNNNYGIAGIAGGDGVNPGCELYDIQMNSLESLNTDIWAFCIKEAVDPLSSHLCHILSISMSTSSPASHETLRGAVRFANAVGANVVCANFNGTSPPLHYPSGYDDPWVTAVGAYSTDGVAMFSTNLGSKLDLVGPGWECPSTSVPGFLFDEDPLYVANNLGQFMYCSCATPHVSGSIGLLRSYLGNSYRPETYENILKLSSIDPVDATPQTWDVDYGHGRLNIGNALANVSTMGIYHFQSPHAKVVDSEYVNVTFMSGPYEGDHLAIRYRLEGRVAFNVGFIGTPVVWGRCQPPYPFGFHGFSSGSPCFGEPFHGIKPESVTNKGCTVYTYIYKLWNEQENDYTDWYPVHPTQIPVGATAMGEVAEKSSGIENVPYADVTVYPNPFNAQISIAF